MTAVTSAFGSWLAEKVAAGDAGLPDPSARALGVIAEGLRSGDAAALEGFARGLGEERAADGLGLDLVQANFKELRGQLWAYLEDFLAQAESWGPADIAAVEALLHQYRDAFLTGYTNTYQQIQRELAQQAEQIEAQRSTIRELSTPILPLYEGIIALPLVGALDSYRAGQVMERLLEAISERQSDIVIMDITGVPVVDTSVANYLLQTAQAAQLVGAEVVLVGVGAEIAQTIVQLGVDLRRLIVYANLQAGIEYALSRQGMEIRRRA